MGQSGIVAGRIEKAVGIASAAPLGAWLRLKHQSPTYLDVGARGDLGARWAAMERLGLIKCVFVEADVLASDAVERVHPFSVIVDKALGAEAAKARLFVTEEPGRSSLLRPKSDERHYQITRIDDIEVVPWDSLDAPAPTFAKIDVQGYELHVLKGMEKALAESIIALQVEVALDGAYEEQPLLADVWAWLDEHGFGLRDLRPLGIHEEKGLIEFNAFFVRRQLSNQEELLVSFWTKLLRIPSHETLISRSD